MDFVDLLGKRCRNKDGFCDICYLSAIGWVQTRFQRENLLESWILFFILENKSWEYDITVS